MLRRVRLERFRGFASVEASLRAATVVVGPNSSGKTTLLHAVRVALRALTDALHAGTSRVDPQRGAEGWIQVVLGGLINDHTRYVAVADWEALFYGQQTGEGQKFTIELEFDEQDAIRSVLVDVRCGRNRQLKLDVHVRAPELVGRVKHLPKKSGQVNTELVRYIEQHAAHAVLIPSFYGVVREEEYRAGVVVNRLLGAGDQSHIVRNLVSRLSADAFTRLNAFLKENLKTAELLTRTTSHDSEAVYPLVVRFRDDDGPLELSAAGAGLVNLVALYAALERYRLEQRQRPVIFLLDEPEAHLHPRLQGDMASRIASLVVRDFGAQVVMATHAVEIVNRLFANEDTIVLRVDRSKSDVTVLRAQSQIVHEIGEWADLTPFSLINFLASHQLLFHEGDSDRTIIETCARLRYRTALARWDRFERWTFAPLSGSGNERVTGLLERLIQTGAIPGLDNEEASVELIVVLDRDHERTPGQSEESRGQMRTTRIVWPVHSIESLFLRPAILERWLRARWGDRAPGELRAWIEEAVAAADGDPELVRDAVGQLLARLHAAGMQDEEGAPLGGDRLCVHAHREASRLVQGEPSVWQRGHDRSRFILRAIRGRLQASLRSQFPTTLHRLLESTPLEQFGDSEAPIPVELRGLLDHMTGGSRTRRTAPRSPRLPS